MAAKHCISGSRTIQIQETAVDECPQGQEKYENLFKLAMEGQWDKLVREYKTNHQAQDAKITSAEDTILHIAVTEERTEIVSQLVQSVGKVEVLENRNDMGNTPLHLAAATGKVAMCRCMVEKHKKLLELRNNCGETPLFMAALHGKKNAFLYLHSQCPEEHGSNYWRRKDGNNILHVAILGEYFDLAFQIIKKYTRKNNPALDLVNFRNERGQLALHLLANNPSAFKSGSQLGRLERVIYHCIVVDPLEETTQDSYEDESESNHKIKLPDNYTTFADLCALLKRLFYFSLGESIHQRLLKTEGMEKVLGGRVAIALISVSKILLASIESLKELVNEKLKFIQLPMLEQELIGVSQPKTKEMKRTNMMPDSDSQMAEVIEAEEMKVKGKVTTTMNTHFHLIITYTVKEKKQKHAWAVQIMEELVSQASAWKYNATGSKPQDTASSWLIAGDPETGTIHPDTGDRKEGKEEDELMRDGKNTVVIKMENMQPRMHRLVVEMTKENSDHGAKKDTAILVAAKHGVKEVVAKILEEFPVAIRDVDADGKNVVLLAVENRQTNVYKLLLKKKYAFSKDSIFQQVDKEGNSALHLAAKLSPNKPWNIPGAALQMQWEIKWYKFVKESMPRQFFTRLNNKGQTSKEVFSETHKDLVKDGGVWLTNTSQSCSVVAALIATVAFATATTVPGGVKETTGKPILEGVPAFEVFAITSLVALCFSVTALTMFLAILTSRYQEADFRVSLPSKLIIGLSALFISIASILVSFCAGHFFVLEDQLKYATLPIYAVTCLPITLFAAAQFPLYLDLIRSSLTSVPRRTYEVTSL
ncbi:hypothetical protein ACLOJK_026746 [Asimina triloba]